MKTTSLMFGFFAAVCIITLGYAFVREASRRRQKRSRFQNRDDLALDEIYNRYYASDGFERDDVLACWKAVAKTLRLPAGRLRPQDRFAEEFAPLRGKELNDEIEELVSYFQDLATDRRIEFKPEEIETLDQLMRRFCEKAPKESKPALK